MADVLKEAVETTGYFTHKGYRFKYRCHYVPYAKLCEGVGINRCRSNSYSPSVNQLIYPPLFLAGEHSFYRDGKKLHPKTWLYDYEEAFLYAQFFKGQFLYNETLKTISSLAREQLRDAVIEHRTQFIQDVFVDNIKDLDDGLQDSD